MEMGADCCRTISIKWEENEKVDYEGHIKNSQENRDAQEWPVSNILNFHLF